jgi:hypothetical protein
VLAVAEVLIRWFIRGRFLVLMFMLMEAFFRDEV